MTREETLKHFKTWCQQTLGNNCSDKDLHMANNIIALLEQQPCEDTISRQAAIDAVGLCRIPSHIKGRIADLPPATPQQKTEKETGRWITSHIPESVLCECSECGFACGAYSFNYCPNCGVRMGVEE